MAEHMKSTGQTAYTQCIFYNCVLWTEEVPRRQVLPTLALKKRLLHALFYIYLEIKKTSSTLPQPYSLQSLRSKRRYQLVQSPVTTCPNIEIDFHTLESPNLFTRVVCDLFKRHHDVNHSYEGHIRLCLVKYKK